MVSVAPLVSASPGYGIVALRDALAKEVASETEFRFVNTRVILRTGVNLQAADGPVDSNKLQRIESMLRAMGYLREYGAQ